MDTDPTQLLLRATEGDAPAAAQLMPLVYQTLRDLAARYLGRTPDILCQTLQPTVLVHEAYLRLVDQNAADFRSRTHFFAVAAQAMRHVLIDHVRGRKRAKRGGVWRRVTLSDACEMTQAEGVDADGLEEVLGRLATLDARAAQVVELRFYGGLTEEEVAAALSVSERTVRNDWSMARAWLRRELDRQSGSV